MDAGGGSRLAFLISVIDRYGSAVECDLHERFGVDLLDFFRGVHPWRKLHALVMGLPGTSRTKAAMAMDDDMVVGLPDEAFRGAKVSPPALTEYSPEAARLDRLVYAVETLIATTVSVAGAKATEPKYPLTPVTAFEREKKRRATARVNSLRAEIEGYIKTS